MTVILPALPRLTRVSPTYRDFSARLSPPSGGQEQRIGRLGDRWSVHYTLPPMSEVQALAFVAAQARATTEGSTVRGVLPRRDAAPVGVTAVGVTNSTVITPSSVDGVTVGMFFSFEAGGHVYLHQVTGIAGGNLNVAPRLRATLNGALNFAAPVVEGFLDGSPSFDIERLALSGVSFTISEDR